jgi:hypothetical protein
MLNRVVFLLASLPFIARAGFESNGRGARPIALGNAFVAMADNQWTTIYNPAGLARIPTIQGALFLVPEQFGLRELRTVSAATAIPFKFATAGLVLEQFGFDLYRETVVAIGVGRIVDDYVAVGMTVNLNSVSIDRYGTATEATIDVGVLVNILSDVRLGFDWKNPSATSVGAARESLPQVQSVGISYELTQQSQICVEVEKDIRFPFVAKLGFEQRFLQSFAFRFGLSNNPDKFSFGMGASTSGLEFSYAGYSHPQLGWTHQVEISFHL